MPPRTRPADGGRLPLPPLNALRAFEAAARHLSFTHAARELCVTQTAISHQVKQLEDDLGVALFRRSPRRITLTPEGRSWATELVEIFSRLDAVNRRLRHRTVTERPTVAVSVMPSFGSRWLVPRLGKFLDAHPDVDIRISASELLVDFALEPFDVGIRYGQGRYPGVLTEKLADDFWVVVAAPALLSRRPLASPRDLERHTLLYDDDREPWNAWLRTEGLPRLPSARYTQITDSSMLVEAAVRGQGLALARRSLAADEIALGRLALPFRHAAPLPTGRSYFLVAPRENFRRPEVASFRDWIRKESASLRQA